MSDYVQIANGRPTVRSAVTTSVGSGDAGKIPKLGADGRLDSTMLPFTDTKTFTASETIPIRSMVHILANGQVALADASNDRAAVGYAPTAIASAASGAVNFEGVLTGFSGLTPGARYFLSDSVPGGITSTAPTEGAGKCCQEVGVALSATELSFEPQVAYLLG